MTARPTCWHFLICLPHQLHQCSRKCNISPDVGTRILRCSDSDFIYIVSVFYTPEYCLPLVTVVTWNFSAFLGTFSNLYYNWISILNTIPKRPCNKMMVTVIKILISSPWNQMTQRHIRKNEAASWFSVAGISVLSFHSVLTHCWLGNMKSHMAHKNPCYLSPTPGWVRADFGWTRRRHSCYGSARVSSWTGSTATTSWCSALASLFRTPLETSVLS